LQAEVPVKTDDSAESLAARVLLMEHQIYPQVIAWFAEGRLKLQNNQVFFDNRALEQPLSLDQLSPNL
jgi:phosphoribosylglycinamide formyltransferase-1